MHPLTSENFEDVDGLAALVSQLGSFGARRSGPLYALRSVNSWPASWPYECRTAPSCEVQTKDGWLAVPLKDARGRYAFAVKRCPVCHGKVAVAGIYSSTARLVLQHRLSHHGCPLQPAHFSGTPSKHPQALA